MGTHRSAPTYSVTCITHDEAVLHCLNALAYFAERVGTEAYDAPAPEPSRLVGPQAWKREEGRVTFQFSDPRRRNLFLGEATRLLSGKWTRLAIEDEAVTV